MEIIIESITNLAKQTFQLSLALLFFLSALFLAKKILIQIDRKFMDKKNHDSEAKDRPIQSHNDSKYTIKREREIIEIIATIKNTHDASASILIDGEWGVGKTSLINLVKEKLNSQNFIFVEINPWYFQNTNQVIKEIFSSINKRLNIRPRDIEPIINPITASLNAFGLNFPINLDNDSAFQDKINNFKNKIFLKLQRENKKLIIIFDDLDRNYEKVTVLTIFKLIKLYLNIKNVHNVVAYDGKSFARMFPELSFFTNDLINKVFNQVVKLGSTNCAPLLIQQTKSLARQSQDDAGVNVQYLDGIQHRNCLNIKTHRQKIRLLSQIESKIASGLTNDILLSDITLFEFIKLHHSRAWEIICENRYLFINKHDRYSEASRLSVINFKYLMKDDEYIEKSQKQILDNLRTTYYKEHQNEWLSLIYLIDVLFQQNIAKTRLSNLNFTRNSITNTHTNIDTDLPEFKYQSELSYVKRLNRATNLDLYFGEDVGMKNLLNYDTYPHLTLLSKHVENDTLGDLINEEVISKNPNGIDNFDSLWRDRIIALSYKNTVFYNNIQKTTSALFEECRHQNTKHLFNSMLHDLEEVKKYWGQIEDYKNNPQNYSLKQKTSIAP